MRETWVRSLGREDSLEKEMATHSSQYSCLENPMDGGAWWTTVHGVAAEQLSRAGMGIFSFTK